MMDQDPRNYSGYRESSDPDAYPPESRGTSVKEKAAEAADKASEKAKQLGRSAADKIDDQRAPAAGALDSAASRLHQTAETLPGGQSVSRVAHNTADKLESTADYIRQHDVRDMMGDVEQFVKSHPGQSLIAAAAVGFLVGRAFRNE
jgi:ElaB/YqjD/DUF883 family membrane-anchored ribosome-binding protein